MMAPMSAEAAVVRNYLDWVLGAALGRQDRGQARRRRGGADPRRGPLRPQEGQGAHPRVPGRAGAGEEAQGADPVPGRPARRRQDVAGAIDRPGDRAQLRAPVAGRRARRGGDPRPPPHVHRRAARQDHPVAEEGRHAQPGLPARRDRQDVDRLPRRPVGGAARGARPRAEHAPSTITTSISTTTCRTSCSSRRRTTCTGSRSRCRTAWRSSSCPATPSGRRSSIAEQYLIPKQKRGQRHRRRRPSTSREDAVRDVIHHYTKEAGVRNLEREIATVCRKIARDVVAKQTPLQAIDGDVAPDGWQHHAQAPAALPRPAPVPLRAAGGRTTRSASSTGSRSRCTAAICWRPRSRSSPGKGKLVLTGKLGDVMQESAQAAMSYVARARRRWGSTATSTAAPTSTCTCPRARSPRTARRRASRWHRPGVGAAARPRAARRRHDRRDHPARARAADRRPQGEDPGRAPRGHHHRDHARRRTPRTCATSRSGC